MPELVAGVGEDDSGSKTAVALEERRAWDGEEEVEATSGKSLEGPGRALGGVGWPPELMNSGEQLLTEESGLKRAFE